MSLYRKIDSLWFETFRLVDKSSPNFEAPNQEGFQAQQEFMKFVVVVDLFRSKWNIDSQKAKSEASFIISYMYLQSEQFIGNYNFE